MNINVEDYLSEDDMKRIAEESFRSACMHSCKENFERILGNAAYALVHKEVDESFDGDMAKIVKEKSIEVIQRISAFDVFRPPNAWDRESSKGWSHMQEAVDCAKPLIQDRINQYVQGISDEELRDLIESKFADAMIQRLIRQ